VSELVREVSEIGQVLPRDDEQVSGRQRIDVHQSDDGV